MARAVSEADRGHLPADRPLATGRLVAMGHHEASRVGMGRVDAVRARMGLRTGAWAVAGEDARAEAAAWRAWN